MNSEDRIEFIRFSISLSPSYEFSLQESHFSPDFHTEYSQHITLMGRSRLHVIPSRFGYYFLSSPLPWLPSMSQVTFHSFFTRFFVGTLSTYQHHHISHTIVIPHSLFPPQSTHPILLQPIVESKLQEALNRLYSESVHGAHTHINTQPRPTPRSSVIIFMVSVENPTCFTAPWCPASSLSLLCALNPPLQPNPRTQNNLQCGCCTTNQLKGCLCNARMWHKYFMLN